MPKWQRILSLVLVHNKQNLIRIRYDWGRELVVIFSTMILLGLFYYIFHDFITIKLQEFPSTFRQAIADWVISGALVGLGLWVAARLKALYTSQPSLAVFAWRSGEQADVLRIYRLCQSALILTINYGLFWLILAPAFVRWDLSRSFKLQAFSLIAGATYWVLTQQNGDEIRELKLRPILSDKIETRRSSLRTWRWYQMLHRNRTCRLCLGLSLIVNFLTGIMLALKWPLPLVVLSCMLGSALLAFALAFQLEEDMHGVWLERQLGCSHEEFVRVYQELSGILGLSLSLLSLGLILITGTAMREPLLEWLKLPCIAAVFPLLTPAIMFQLAPDRPMLQILTTSLIGLFLGTAIYANIFATALVALAIYYAKKYQQDNFYRS